MRIKFSNLVDFIAELEKDKDKIERGIVRVNFERRATKFSPNVSTVFLVAECIIAGHILALRVYCGDLWGIGGTDEETKLKYSDKHRILEAELTRLGITDIRGGAIEDAGEMSA